MSRVGRRWVLLIDTTRPQVWVAVGWGDELCGVRQWPGDRTLGSRLVEAIDLLMTDVSLTWSDIARVAVNPGPGHFSATRTGVTTANLLVAPPTELVAVHSHDVGTALREAHRATPVSTLVPIYLQHTESSR